MKARIERWLEKFLPLGYVILIAVSTIIGWQWGKTDDRLVLGAFLGLVLGFGGATLLVGLISLRLDIKQDTEESRPSTPGEFLKFALAQMALLGGDSKRFGRLLTHFYIIVFFAYLFLPLLIMAAAAFNQSSYPSAHPWQGFTLHWFGTLFANDDMWLSVLNSILIGIGVICITVPLGLAGALLITRLQTKAKTFIYALLVSPILTPGIILGISTLILWNNFGVPGGLFLAMIAQSTFIAATIELDDNSAAHHNSAPEIWPFSKSWRDNFTSRVKDPTPETDHIGQNGGQS